MMSYLSLFSAGVPNLAMVESVDDKKVNSFSGFTYFSLKVY